MIGLSYSNIDIIQGVLGYGNATEGITDWRITNTSGGVFNILNSSSIITPSGGTSEIGEIPGTTDRYMIFRAGTSTITVPTGGINCDILIVGGGGGGGFDGSGGGGGGEVKYYTNNTTTFKTGNAYTLSEGIYTINVGTGGAPGVSVSSAGVNGTISEIKNNLGATLLLAGGGGGGGSKNTNGVSGVGGGGGAGHGASYTGGSSTGNGGIGGNSFSAYTGGGGGGGANVANKNGGNGQSNIAGTGGVGVDINITGISIGVGGGGGGGTHISATAISGTHGGGRGGEVNTIPTSGTSGTGGGGGGGGALGAANSSGTGGSGGSGIVIIRYSTTKISIIDNGNVGIGTTPVTNSSLLEIAGDVNITGSYRINNIDVINATSNYVGSTSNILTTRISSDIQNTSNYVGIINTSLNTSINNTSNYIASIGNISVNNVNSQWSSTSSGIYYNTPISESITLPSEIGTDIYMSFTYTTDTIANSGQTQYTINVPSGGIVCDILIVGGGGGGGNAIYNSSHEPGGGGAGGVVYMINKTLNFGTYKINVGNGGSGNTNGNNSTITDNNNSILTFDNILLIGKGGGKGATGHQTVGGDGGSGGGGGHDRANGGLGTQGNTFWNGTTYIAGGNNGAKPGGGSSGGGGGGAGEAGDADGGGSGGDGVQVNITGTNTFYAGGGNAYYNTSTTRSDGGGGTLNGTSSSQNGGNALPNTGSGGSGAFTANTSSYTGGSGGSGIVIIRYNTFLPLTSQNSIISAPIITPTTTTVLPGITSGTIDIDRYIILTYTSDNTGTGQTQYNINIPTDNIICDILMVGGGGAGGKDIGGGGGGGAVLYGTNINIAKRNYIVKVGRGATPGEVRGKPTEGFGATILGGGCASNTGWDPPNANGGGNTGGSGAGGKGVQTGYSVPSGGRFGISTKGPILASSIIYNGNLGGSGMVQGASGTKVAGGGGGGAGGKGSDATIATGRGGDGGDGVEINIIGTSYWWGAGGGGDTEGINNTITGGNGGKGGGGSGGGSQAGVIGQTINGNVGTNGYGAASGKNAGSGTGSGGGGARYQDTIGGNGGSGIIIIRYRNRPSITNVGIGTTNPIADLHVYDDTTNNTTVSVQNNYLDPVVITPNNRHTVTETIENNKYYRTLTFTYNVSYPVLAADVDNLVAWYKLDGNLISSSRAIGTATLPNGAITYTTDTTKFSNLPNYISATFNGTASGAAGTANVTYALTPTINKNVPLSFAFWFMTTGTAYYTIMGYGDKSANNPKIQFDFLNEGGSYQLKVFTALNNQWTISPTVTGLSLNTWYFCVYTLSNTSPVNCILYINGTQRATGSGNAGQYLTLYKDLTIGASGDGGRGFVGQIADVRIYNKVLSLEEITTLYTVNTPASIVSTINFRIPTPIFINGGSSVTVQGLYNISVGPTNSSVLKAQGQAIDPFPSTATTTISIKYEYKDATLSLPKLIDVPGTTTTTIGTTDRCISFPYTTETIANTGQTEYIFSPTESIVCDILLVGGGGSGGNAGGSGGGGDVLEFNNINLNTGSYRILVGNGGIIVQNNNVTGTVGKNSSITINNNTITAAGGGGGQAVSTSSPSAIPTATFLHPITLLPVTSSGGGGGGAQSSNGAIGTGISGNGGKNADNNGNTGGGGGGAAPPPLGNGGNSSIGTPSYTGNGGRGISSSITGTLIEYGGGGGGTRWNYSVTTPGTASGGGGYQRGNVMPGEVWGPIHYFSEDGRGGGGSQNSGGSGIVIIRYRKVVSSASIELIRLSNNDLIRLSNNIVNELVIPGTTSTVIGTDRCIRFFYSGSATTMDYTFTTTEPLNCDLLIIGGGGGGGNWSGGNYECGGGGAGAYLYIQNIIIDGTYTINVGKGGELSSKGANTEIKKGSTVLYSCEGGGNGGFNGGNAGSGGSGGGGLWGYGQFGIANNPTIGLNTNNPVRGFSGAPGTTNNGANDGGGGGGAGGPGILKTGGIGQLNNITGENVYYAAGGGGCSYHSSGGGIGGLGGGGTGSTGSTNATAGQDNTGSGGGGGYYINSRQAGKGGSGIVIMRYRRYTVTNYKIGNFNGDFKIIAASTGTSIAKTTEINNIEYLRIAENGSSIYNPTGTPLWSTISDKRIKENIERASYEKCYNNIQNLELYRFNYISELNNINKDLKQLGYIAQEVNEIFPKSVSSQTLYNGSLSISDLLSIDITQINYTLFGSVKRLIELINNKIQRLEKLENILNINNSKNKLTSNLIVDTITSNIDVEVITSNLIVDTITSNIDVEVITSNLIVDTITSNFIVEK